MNAQDIFDTVARHLLTMPHQALQSFEPGFRACAYRGVNNVPCGAGVLLTDKEVKVPQELQDDPENDTTYLAETLDDIRGGTSVHEVFNAGLLPERLVPHLDLLSELQNTHDRTHLWTQEGLGPCRPEPMKEALRTVAGLHELSTEVLQ